MHIKDFDPYDFSKKEIGGVPVYYKNLPWAPCISIRVVFNSGAYDDPIGKEGLSHFFEHLIFNGSPKLPNKKDVNEWSKIHALNSWNASTYYNNTTYSLRCLPEEYNKVIPGIKDMIFYSYLRPEDVEHERKVIIQEAWGRFENEKKLKYIKHVKENIFNGTNDARFARPLGWPETISKISHSDIVSYHKKYHGIGNFFIILVGAVEEKHIENLKDFIKDLPKVEPVKRLKEKINKPISSRLVIRADEIGEVKSQVEISISRTADSFPYIENEKVNLFRNLYADLLHERLRIEQALCYGVRVFKSLEKTYSQIIVSVSTDEKNIEIVEEESRKILDEIKNNKYIDRFNLIKKIYLESIKAQERSTSGIADRVVYEVLENDDNITTLEEQLNLVEQVTYEDIVKFADWAFDPEYIYTEIILPSKK